MPRSEEIRLAVGGVIKEAGFVPHRDGTTAAFLRLIGEKGRRGTTCIGHSIVDQARAELSRLLRKLRINRRKLIDVAAREALD